MRATIIVTSLLVALPSVPALAQDQAEGQTEAMPQVSSWQEIEDLPVMGPDGNEIGEIEEVLINASGEVVAVTVEAGGFLDIGDEEIVFTMDMLSFEGGQYVTDMAATDIEGLPRYDD